MQVAYNDVAIKLRELAGFQGIKYLLEWDQMVTCDDPFVILHLKIWFLHIKRVDLALLHQQEHVDG